MSASPFAATVENFVHEFCSMLYLEQEHKCAAFVS